MKELSFHKTLEEYYSIFIKINSLYSAFAKEKGLSYHALFVLYAIYHSEGGCSPKEICDKWLIPKQTVTSVLRIFDERGFVCYAASQQDRRAKVVLLSDEGRAYAQPMLDALYRIEAAAFETMGVEQVQQLVVCSRSFQEKMEEELKKHGNE